MKSRTSRVPALVATAAALAAGSYWAFGAAASAANSGAPARSSPIAITSDNQFVLSVNPDNDSVSVFRVRNDANEKLLEVPVGDEPWCVAVTPNDRKAYVVNQADGTVSVLARSGSHVNVVKTIRVGTEPFGCALTPDGKKLYVANQGSDTISVINTVTDKVVKTITNAGSRPHGLAITADGTKVYATQFLALPRANDPRPLTQSEGADDGREGRVTVINALNDSVAGTVILAPIANTGFNSDGSTLGREPILPGGTPVFDNATGGFSNLLESIFIRGNTAFIPNTCSSPNGPFRFNVNVQSCLSTINTQQDVEAFPTFNMNKGVQFEPAGVKLFNTNPFAVAFKKSKAEGFIALGATDRLLRVTLNADGSPTVGAPAAPGDPGTIVRIQLKDPQEILQDDPDGKIGGQNPRGIVLNSTDTRAYVFDFISRDVAVVDIAGDDPAQYKTIARIQSADVPTAGVDAIVHRGKQLFNTSIGPVGTAENSLRPAGLMADFGWGTCYSCHPQALTDSVTWMFADGPRQAISMESTFTFGAAVIENGAPKLPESHQRALNWSSVRDSVQDFERNIRAVSGGGGLIREPGVPEGVAGLGQIPDLLVTANFGRDPDLDAIATYLALGVRAPNAPVRDNSFGAQIGRVVFEVQGCQNCHGGPNWTISEIDYTPPAVAADVVDAQLIRTLCQVGTFDPNLFADGVSNEIRSNNIANVQARGKDGFNPSSLISVYASAPYLHSGAAPTLEAVLDNVTHRNAGNTSGFDVLQFAPARQALVRFLKSIDRESEPFTNVTPPSVCGPQP